MRRRRPPDEILVTLRGRLEGLPARSPERLDAILDPAAVDLLASRLRTPLQIEQHLTLALETGYQASEKPVGEAIVDSVLSKQIDDLDPDSPDGLAFSGFSVL